MLLRIETYKEVNAKRNRMLKRNLPWARDELILALGSVFSSPAHPSKILSYQEIRLIVGSSPTASKILEATAASRDSWQIVVILPIAVRAEVSPPRHAYEYERL